MRQTSKTGGREKMSKFLCTDVSTQAGKTALRKSVEQIIRQNKKVFDNLAKS